MRSLFSFVSNVCYLAQSLRLAEEVGSCHRLVRGCRQRTAESKEPAVWSAVSAG